MLFRICNKFKRKHWRFLSSSDNRRKLIQDADNLSSFVTKQSSVPLTDNNASEMSIPDNLDPTAPFSPKSFYLETYGCQMNVSDSDIVRSILESAGYVSTADVTSADVILANTCAIRENPEQKVWNRIAHFGNIKARNKKIEGIRRHYPIVGILGCMAERIKSKLLQHPAVDLVSGPDAYRDLPRLLDVAFGSDSKSFNVQLSLEETYADIVPIRQSNDNKTSAYVSIMRGCNNMCSFCIVPFTRGRERSRSGFSIIDEVRRLVDDGTKEIVLLGQNVNSYHDKSDESIVEYSSSSYETSSDGFTNMYRSRQGSGRRFADLLAEVAEVDKDVRIRFTSPHPKDFSHQVVSTIKHYDNICKSIHLPLQAGSNQVLTNMRRGYSREAYLDLVNDLRCHLPGVGLSTDLISGFCQETEDDHADTIDMIDRVGFDQAFTYAYSRREKTHAAYHLKDDVSEVDKQRRLRQVIDSFHKVIMKKNLLVETGQVHLVLIEGKCDGQQDGWTGRTDTNKRVLMHSDVMYQEFNVELARSILNGKKSYLSDYWTRNWNNDNETEIEHQLQPPRSCNVAIQAGDYAAVVVDRATGHTLRGRIISKTNISDFFKIMKQL